MFPLEDKFDSICFTSLGCIPSCPPEETFLYRLLEAGHTESIGANATIKYVKETLASRHSCTMKFMKHLKEAIDAQRAKTENLALILGGKVHAEGKKSFE